MIAGILLQEKSIRDPADTRLYDRLHERLVKSVRENGIKSKLTNGSRKGAQGDARANQFKRSRKATKQLKTFL